jgi:hypothetical protein
MTIMVTVGLLAGGVGFTNHSTDSSGQHYLCSTTVPYLITGVYTVWRLLLSPLFC